MKQTKYYRQSKVNLDDTSLADNGMGWQSGYSDVNLRFDWVNVAGQPLDIGLFVRNATNELHALSINSFLTVNGSMNTVYNEPRMWGLELRWRFGAEASQARK
jgi:iron complex outermembrane recepter protein